MKYAENITALFILFAALTASGCKKESNNTPANPAPSNLVVNAVVSSDGSGNVNFTATATNAVTYDFEYGDAVVETGTDGTVTHRYTLTGTNTFTVKVTAKSSSGASVNKTIPVTVTVTVTAPTLLWSEEFNTDGLPNPAKWGYDLGAGGWGNNESQYYTSRAENAVVINGNLKITLKKEAYSGSNYTSARLLTKDKFSFKYGKVEVRAKLPSGGGTWPAIWMLGNDIGTVGWPACGEIDIMEHVGNDQNRIHGTLHYPGRSGGNANTGSRIVSNVSTEFHVYSLDWSATEIKISVDGQTVHTVANSASIPFNHNFF
ncbi:MAG TPA: family 16 glycosylhydrolase, partial [Ferruginibacter sp.]|nr:family 16 glycosylhydrolase [Ferruginibacter sp.]